VRGGEKIHALENDGLGAFDCAVKLVEESDARRASIMAAGEKLESKFAQRFASAGYNSKRKAFTQFYVPMRWTQPASA